MGVFNWFFRSSRRGPVYSVMNDDHVHLYRTLDELKACFGMTCHSNDERVQRWAKIMEIFNTMIATSREHFRREEALMEIYNFPDLKTHRTEHIMLARSVEMYLSRLTENPNAIDSTVVSYLKSWLTNHIRTTDRELEQFLIRVGRSQDAPDLASLIPSETQGPFAFLRLTLRDSVPRHTVEEQRKRAQSKSEQVNKWKDRYRQRDEQSQIRGSLDEKARQQRAMYYE